MNKLQLKKKIVIGTANFTQKYGVDQITVNQIEIKKILDLAKKNDIIKIDTAEGYLNNLNLLKDIDKKFQFISKVKLDKRWLSLDFCQKNIEDHFNKLNTNKIQTLLIHNPDILWAKESSKIYQNLEFLKKKKYFKNIGLSIYDVNYLKDFVNNYNFDVVQCPYNLLDKRIVNSGWFNKLKSKGIEIHVRSIFLQGLLVNESFYKKKYFKKWKKFFFEWFKILEYNNISAIDYCLSDILQHNFDQIIIGINNCDNLKKIINFKIIKDKVVDLNMNDLNLIDPRNWK